MTNTDLIKVAKQLDKIITSERAEVKEAFRELMIVSALIESDDIAGPLTTLVDRVHAMDTEIRKLNDRVSMFERENSYRRGELGSRSYSEAMERSSIWDRSTLSDQTNPFKTLYERTYINKLDTDDHT